MCVTSSLLGIAAFKSLDNQIKVYSFLINQTSVLFMIEIISILVFGIILLDPDKLDIETIRLKKKAEEYYQEKTKTKQNDEGKFDEFLRNYNLLENLITIFANKMYVKDYQITYKSSNLVNLEY